MIHNPQFMTLEWLFENIIIDFIWKNHFFLFTLVFLSPCLWFFSNARIFSKDDKKSFFLKKKPSPPRPEKKLVPNCSYFPSFIPNLDSRAIIPIVFLPYQSIHAICLPHAFLGGEVFFFITRRKAKSVDGEDKSDDDDDDSSNPMKRKKRREKALRFCVKKIERKEKRNDK